MSINFELKTPIKYSNGSGQEIECNFIELKEPTGKVSHACCAIEGLIQSGIIKMSDILGQDVIEQAKEEAAKNKDKPAVDEEKDGEAVYSMMVGSGVDMNKLVLYFREVFMQRAWMGGEKPITSARLDDMAHSDFRRMVGVYAANFILS